MLPSAISGYAVTFFLSAALYLLLATNSAFVAVGPTVTLHSDVNFPTVTFTVASPSPFAVIVPFSFTVNTCSSLDSHLAVVSSVVSSGLILSSMLLMLIPGCYLNRCLHILLPMNVLNIGQML